MIPANLVIDRMMRRTGYCISDLRAHDRHWPVVRVRQQLMVELYDESGWSCSAIGRLLDRDRTTVMHAVQTAAMGRVPEDQRRDRREGRRGWWQRRPHWRVIRGGGSAA